MFCKNKPAKVLYSFVAACVLCTTYSQELSVQTLFGNGEPGQVDGIGLAAQFYSVRAITPTPSGLVFFDAAPESVLIRSFSLADRRVTTITNRSVLPTGEWSQVTPSFLDGPVIWMHTTYHLIKQSLDPEVRSIYFFSRPLNRPSADGDLAYGIVNWIGGMERGRAAGEFILLDSGSLRFRRASVPDYSVAAFSCTGVNEQRDGSASEASFSSWARCLARTGDGSIYFLDGPLPGFLRCLNPDGSVETVKQFGGTTGWRDGPIESALFSANIRELASYPADGSILILDGRRLRKMSRERIVSTIINQNQALPNTYRDGPSTVATLYQASKFTGAQDGSIYFIDSLRMRKITFAMEQPGFALTAALHPSLRIDGTIGRTYRIEAAETADATEWETVGQVTLTRSPQTWFDENSPAISRRFYRAVLLP